MKYSGLGSSPGSVPGLHILISPRRSLNWMTSESLPWSNSRIGPFILDADVLKVCTKEA